MLLPKRIKYSKLHRSKNIKKSEHGCKVSFGDYALQAVDAGWLTSRQIEAGRRVLTRYIKRTGKLWIRVFPHHPITKRPESTRMGSGKGSCDYWVAVIKPGNILYEISGLTETVARAALQITAHKIPLRTKIKIA